MSRTAESLPSRSKYLIILAAALCAVRKGVRLAISAEMHGEFNKRFRYEVPVALGRINTPQAAERRLANEHSEERNQAIEDDWDVHFVRL